MMPNRTVDHDRMRCIGAYQCIPWAGPLVTWLVGAKYLKDNLAVKRSFEVFSRSASVGVAQPGVVSTTTAVPATQMRVGLLGAAM